MQKVNIIICIILLAVIGLVWSSIPPINATLIANAQNQSAQHQSAQTSFDCAAVSEISQLECQSLLIFRPHRRKVLRRGKREL
ncbi:MAG: hypothetical protein AAF639_46265 [Chloroflexota bacterium]